MSKNLMLGAILLCVIATLSSCKRIEDRDHIVCFSQGMEDRSRYWGDVEVRSSLRGESASFRNRGNHIAVIWLETSWYEMDRVGMERVKEIAAKIGGNGIITSGSRSGDECLEAHTRGVLEFGGDRPRWQRVRVVDVPQLSCWSQSPFYDADPNVRFKWVIDEWNGVSKLLFEMTSEMDWPEELILVESIWWDILNRITNLKRIYRAELEGRSDFDEALRLMLQDAHRALSRYMDEVDRMSRYHEDDEFAEIYRLLDNALESLMDQFVCERELWWSRKGR